MLKLETTIKRLRPSSTDNYAAKYQIEVTGVGTEKECNYIASRLLHGDAETRIRKLVASLESKIDEDVRIIDVIKAHNPSLIHKLIKALDK